MKFRENTLKTDWEKANFQGWLSTVLIGDSLETTQKQNLLVELFYQNMLTLSFAF